MLVTFVLKHKSGKGQYSAGDHCDWSCETDVHMAQVLIQGIWKQTGISDF